ncbi:unnamed protein product [Trifolium pratense]|uniref:Uncharacterized protein n=2 Tax=Trifolium pratense TaxID=57577 RepID=A0ACB0MCY5_TRIPR|nr:unnamed protein product [Trifolium pratense]CAJ2679774.1 unnamed protein product [Trifolium pratense]
MFLNHVFILFIVFIFVEYLFTFIHLLHDLFVQLIQICSFCSLSILCWLVCVSFFIFSSDDRVVLLPPMNGCGSDESLPSGDSRLCMEAYKNLLAKSLNMKIDASSCPGS